MPVLVLSAAALPAHRDEASVQLLRSWPTAQHARVHAAQDAPHRCSRPHFPISSCWAACCYTASIVMVAAQPATAWWASSVVGGAAGVGFDSLASVWAFLLLGFALGQVSILEAVESIHANERVRGDATGCVRAGKRRSSSLFVRGSIATEQATQAAAVRETLSLSHLRPPPLPLLLHSSCPASASSRQGCPPSFPRSHSRGTSSSLRGARRGRSNSARWRSWCMSALPAPKASHSLFWWR